MTFPRPRPAAWTFSVVYFSCAPGAQTGLYPRFVSRVLHVNQITYPSMLFIHHPSIESFSSSNSPHPRTSESLAIIHYPPSTYSIHCLPSPGTEVHRGDAGRALRRWRYFRRGETLGRNGSENAHYLPFVHGL